MYLIFRRANNYRFQGYGSRLIGKCVNLLTKCFELFLNYHAANKKFAKCFFSFITFFIITRKFGGKYYSYSYKYKNEFKKVICQVGYKKKIETEIKNATFPTLQFRNNTNVRIKCCTTTPLFLTSPVVKDPPSSSRVK